MGRIQVRNQGFLTRPGYQVEWEVSRTVPTWPSPGTGWQSFGLEAEEGLLSTLHPPPPALWVHRSTEPEGKQPLPSKARMTLLRKDRQLTHSEMGEGDRGRGGGI